MSYKSIITTMLSVVILISTTLNLNAQRNQNSLSSKIDSLNNLSFEYKKINNELAIKWARESIDLNADNLYQDGLNESYLNLAINYLRLFQNDSAFKYLSKCDGYFEDDFRVGMVLYYTGVLHSNLDNHDDADKYLNKASEYFERAESNEYLAEVQNSLGIVYYLRGEYVAALEHFKQAYQLKLEIDLPYDQELNNISIVYRRMNQYEESLEFAKKSLSMVTEMKDTLGISQTLISVGNSHIPLKNLDSAIYYFSKSYDLAIKNKFQSEITTAIVNIAIVHETMGKNEPAIKKLRQIISNTPVEWKFYTGVAYHELGVLYHKIENYDSAIFFCKEGLAIATTREDELRLKNNAEVLYKSYKELKMYDSAFHYLSIYNTNSQIVEKEKADSRFGDLRVKLETLEKVNKIKNLNAELKYTQVKRQNNVIILVGVVATLSLLIIILVYRHKNKQKKQRIEQLELKQEIKQQERELHQQTLYMISTNNHVSQMESSLKELKSQPIVSHRDIQKLLNGVLVNKSSVKEWQQFDLYFSKTHPTFGSELLSKHSNLTQLERRLVSLIKMDLSNREISDILNIEHKSVIMSKYRLKKKLGLDDKSDLGIYVHSL